MSIYLAPMEGITGYIFRNAYNSVYGHCDKYFAPFVSNVKFNAREKKDIDPANNVGINLVPQILTNKAADFVTIARQLEDMGYETVNLNLGCPSGTVVAKNRGAGFLAVLDRLEEFLDEIFSSCSMNISVKTRIGVEFLSECEDIIKLYNRYPLEELIIHPRLQKDFYNGTPHLEEYALALSISTHKVCYNGDITSVDDYEKITSAYPKTDSIMIGRGILTNPGLAGEIKHEDTFDMQKLRVFHKMVYEGYKETMSGCKPTLCKMKELWWYLGRSFKDSAKLIKKIKKCETFEKYDAIMEEVFDGQIYTGI